MAVDIANRKSRLMDTVAISENVINSAKELEKTSADFKITSESKTASGLTTIKAYNNNNLALYVLIAIFILLVVGFLVFKG